MHSLISTFIKNRPQQAAKYFEYLSLNDTLTILLRLDPHIITTIAPILNPYIMYNLFQSMPKENIEILVDLLDAKILSHVLRGVETPTKKIMLNSMKSDKRIICLKLMTYEEEMVGAWMQPNIFRVHPDHICVDVIKKIYNKKYLYKTNILYVTTSDYTLLGVVLVSTIMKNKSNHIVDFIENVIGTVDSKQHIVDIKDMHAWLQVDSIPVVDNHNKLLGVLHHLDVRRALDKLHIEAISPSSLSDFFGEMMSVCSDTFIEAANVLTDVERNQ